MSYILDALRRSETERQQGRMPDLAQSVQMVHKPRRKSIPLAVWVTIGFFINALVLAVIFWPGSGFLATAVDAKTQSADSADSSATAPPAPSTGADARATNISARASVDSDESRSVPENPIPGSSGRQTAPAPTSSESASNSAGESARVSADGVVVRPAVHLQQEPAKTGQETSDVGVDYVAGANQQDQQATLIVPDRSRGQMATFTDNPGTATPQTAEHLMEKSLDYQRRIPTLHFSSHIYASDPAARRVTINGHYLRVGDRFDGIRVDAIKSDGVILSAYGDSFRVGVVSDWISPR